MLGPRRPELSAQQTPQPLLRWLRASLTRRVVLIGSSLVLAVAIQLTGLAPVPGAVFAVFGIWLSIAIVSFAALRTPWARVHIWRVHMAAQVVDILGTIAFAHAIGVTLWFAPLLLALSVTLGGQTLPRNNAIVLALIASAAYAVALLGEVYGFWPVSGPFANVGPPSTRIAIVAIAMISMVLIAVAAIQRGFFRQVSGLEERHARLLEAARDIICILDSEGRIQSANAAIETQLGWKRDEIVGSPFESFVAEPDRVLARDRFRAVLRGETIQTDINVIAGDGRARLLSITGAPIRDEQGRVEAALGVARDVTERRAHARRLEESERQLRLLVRSVNETVFTLDRDLHFTAMFGLLGPGRQDAAHVLAKTPAEALGAAFGEAMVAPARRALAGEPNESYQQASVNGEERHFRIGFTPLRDDDGGIVGVTGVAFDITAQRLAERERDLLRTRLEESRRAEALGRLVSGVAHEINNPLAAILTFAEQLRSEARSSADAIALEAIHSQAMRSRAIVRDLIAFARPRTQRPVTAVRPGPLLDTTLRSLLPHLMSLGVEFIADVRADQAWIAADALAIEQLVTNLVLNAAQAAGIGGRVTVRAAAAESQFSMVVEDSGPGIADEALTHLYEPFFTTKAVGEGTGLGLFVARGIVQQHGGTIRAENRAAPERGARFVVEIPLVPAPGAAQDAMAGAGVAASEARRSAETPVRTSGGTPVLADAASGTSPVPRPGGRVLLIDDEAPIRQSLRRFFTRRGWDVMDVSEGGQALKALHDAGPSAFTMVLCDIRMPGMGGAELHARLATEMPELLDRMVLVSGDVVSPETAEFVASTKCRLLEKPFELRVLGVLADELLAVHGGASRGEGPETSAKAGA